MGVQLRVSLPDQPGTLARISRAIAASGADVLWVCVLESEGGRAIDDFGLRWPDDTDFQPLLEAVAAERGIEVISCRSSRRLMAERADLDLLGYLLTAPGRGVETLVDMAPAALDADWAQLREPDRSSPARYPEGVPAHDELAPDRMPVRAMAGSAGEVAWAQFPLAALGMVLVIGRDGGPPFLRPELRHAETVIALALRTLVALRDTKDATDLTASLTTHKRCGSRLPAPPGVPRT
ncbi:MAG TPA: hypothetical protein VG899_02210 [Mycobacteriales bacterium]|nr:hypothetical protein [Mycobacteriales bacterium]